MRGRTWLWVLFLVLGVAVRFRQYLFAHSYWYDEAFLVLTVEDHSYAELLGPQPYNLVIPPAFLWMIRGLYELGGKCELVLRLPAFIAAIASLLVMIPLARRVAGPVHGLWAFAFLAISRHAISHGCEVRPYTVDLLLSELIILCAAVLADVAASLPRRRWAAGGLLALAAVGPWMSFPSAIVLGGASVAMLPSLTRRDQKMPSLTLRDQKMPSLTLRALIRFCCVAGVSVALLWWFSARHMYYDGMIEHWGHRGWGGFPDWSSAVSTAKWIVSRPLVIGNYGNRELGIVLTLLAVIGGWRMWKQSRSLVILLTAPLFLTILAALAGKYPLAHRTGLFLLPCMWLLAACGIGAAIEWGASRGRSLAWLGPALVSWDCAFLLAQLIMPDPGLDYRGAYEYVQTHRRNGDLVWSQAGVVYQTYYGKQAPIYLDHEIDAAVEQAKRNRMWFVAGDDRHDLEQQFAAVAGEAKCRHHVSGLSVFLFDADQKVPE